MIQVTGLYKEYVTRWGDKTDALIDISFETQQGETTILSGPNGSGKSTLLAIISGLVHPTSGTVRVLDKEISKLPDSHRSSFRRRHIGIISQEFELVPDLTIEENLIIPLIACRYSRREMVRQKKAVTEQFDLGPILKKTVNTLSGGEKQRSVIARAFINSPTLLLADEPTSQIDQTSREAFLSYLFQLKAKGLTLMIASHDPFIVDSRLGDRQIRLDQGRLVTL